MASTTVSPAAISCTPDLFCNVAADESSYMLGPLQMYQTYLLFSGPCVLEYAMDYAAGNLAPQTAPQLLNTYLQGVGGPAVTTPVDLVSMAFDPLTYYSSMSLTLINKATSTELTCSTDGTKTTNAVTCPSMPASASLITTATSSSPQICIDDGIIYNYIVDASQTEIALVDPTFGTTYQTSTGFLNGQAQITKITAIQIIEDPSYANPKLLAVFGAGPGCLPYVGFVSMDLSASPSVPLVNFKVRALVTRTEKVVPLFDTLFL
ncbi:hypothetical protein RvY_01340-2 [Ramazzottius varieornatus]|uniref:Uncharacterized protein n=1 Tax=Ramazzottius varieornatus TaxID=947166 RepID=A0A1D1UN44_RAMVA|nr:hypothetical protein RvY_01340-2 [Ramazzottius varieornatus]